MQTYSNKNILVIIILLLFLFFSVGSYVVTPVLAGTNEQTNDQTNKQDDKDKDKDKETEAGSKPAVSIFKFDTKVGEDGSILRLMQLLINILMGLIASVAVVFIVIGGFQLVLSQGQSEKLKAAKETIQWAVIGLVIALLVFTILQTVIRVIAK